VNRIDENQLIPPDDMPLFQAAWETARANHSHDFTFYLPGMVKQGHERGRYPAISITGDDCQLMCEHCKGQLLEPMIKVSQPDELIRKCHRLKKLGTLGILLSGGSDRKGRLPWESYYAAIKSIKDETPFFISAHTGFPDQKTCHELKKAGVTQALIDVMGDEETASLIYHLKGLKQIVDALESIAQSGLQLIPHIVAGLFYGNINAEYRALEIIRHYRPSALVIVVLTPLKGTSMAHVTPPSPQEVGRLIANARIVMPEVPISLGCERPRNKAGRLMENLAILAGANRMAIWSDGAIQQAKNLGLRPRFQPTCCSLDFREDFGSLHADCMTK